MQGSFGSTVAAWTGRTTRTHWKTLLVGLAAGVTYETVTEIQPLANALSEALGASPSTIGTAVAVALVAGLAGTRVFVPLAEAAGHRAVQTGMALALIGVMLAASPAIGDLGTTGLYLVAALSGFFGRGFVVGHHWVSTHEPGRRIAMGFVLQAGTQVGLTLAKLADSLLVRGARWQPGFLGQAVALVVAAALFAWLLPAREAAEPRPLMRGAARVLTTAGRRLEARAARPREETRRRARPAAWGGALRRAATPATRIVFFQQAALWAFDTYVVYLLVAKGLDEGDLPAVLLPVAISALVVPFAGRLGRWPAITRLISVGLIALAWPAVAAGVLTAERAAFVAVLFTATMGLEPGTTIWSAVGPVRATEEAGAVTRGQANFDNARTLGALAGILLGGRCLGAFGPLGLAIAGCSIGAVAVWDGLLRGPVRAELRRELAALLEAHRERRALPLRDAALIGCATALGRASFPSVAPFLLAISGDVGGGSTTAAKAGLAAGAAGFSAGLAVALRRRGRMVGRRTVLAGYLLAAAGGASAALAPTLWAFAAGLLVLGFGAAIPQLVQASVRAREAHRGAAAVNSEIEVWVLPSVGVVMLGTAVLGYATSWRWALALVSALVAVTGVAMARWQALPAPVPVTERVTRLRRVLRRPANRRRAVVSAAYYGSLLAFYTPLALLLEEHGWGARAVPVIAGLGSVRLLAPPIMRRIGVRAAADPYAAARAAFAWSVAGGLVLLGAPFLPPDVTPLVAVLAIGFLIAEGFTGGGWAATKAQSDSGHDVADAALLLALSGAAGAAVAGVAIAPLDWVGSCVVGLALALMATWLSGWPALTWSRHAFKGQGSLRLVTHRGPDGTVWLLAESGAKAKAFRLRPSEQLVLAHRDDGVVFARWTASPRPGTHAFDRRTELGGRRRSMRWLDGAGERAGRLAWTGDDRVAVRRLPQLTLGVLSGRLPREASASASAAVATHRLDGPDLDARWVMRTRVHRTPPAGAAPERPAAAPPGPKPGRPVRRRVVIPRRRPDGPITTRDRRRASGVATPRERRPGFGVATPRERRPATPRERPPDGPLVMAHCEYGVVPEPGRDGPQPRTTATVAGTGADALLRAAAGVPAAFIERLGPARDVLDEALRSAYDRRRPIPAGAERWLVDGVQHRGRRLLVLWTSVD